MYSPPLGRQVLLESAHRTWARVFGGLCPDTEGAISAIAPGNCASSIALARALVSGSPGKPLLRPQQRVKATSVLF